VEIYDSKDVSLNLTGTGFGNEGGIAAFRVKDFRFDVNISGGTARGIQLLGCSEGVLTGRIEDFGGNQVMLRADSATSTSTTYVTVDALVKDGGNWGIKEVSGEADYNLFKGVLDNNAAGNIDVNGSNSSIQGEVASKIPSDVAGSRSPATWYQNTKDVPIFVTVTCYTNTSGSQADLYGHVNTSQTNNIIVRSTTANSGGEYVRASIQFIVPPDAYYKVNIVSGTMGKWQEQELGRSNLW